MLVNVFTNQTLTAVNGSGAGTFTPRIAVGQNNYANITLNLRDIEELQGTPGVALDIAGEGSIVGQNFVGVGGLALGATATGVLSAEGSVPYPWLRFHVLLTVGGAPGDKVAVVFDLQANLVRK